MPRLTKAERERRAAAKEREEAAEAALLLADDPRTDEEREEDEKAAEANEERYPARPYSEAVSDAQRAALAARGLTPEDVA